MKSCASLRLLKGITDVARGPVHLREGRLAGDGGQVSAQETAHARHSKHQGLVPLLLLAVAAVVHQHGHALAALTPQDLGSCLRAWAMLLLELQGDSARCSAI